MTPFQIAAILGLSIVSTWTIVAIARKRLTPVAGVFWLALWIAGVAAISWPAITVAAARAVGIARGADLVSYLAILAMLVGFFTFNVRVRRIESQITQIVRELAIRGAEQPSVDTGTDARRHAHLGPERPASEK
ncbi:MAG: DUF2304 domain-containing protein [Thermoanaerobaculia bacterium]